MKDKKDSFLTGKERRLRKKGGDKQIEKELEEEAGGVVEAMVESAEHTGSKGNESTDNKAESELCGHHPHIDTQQYDLPALEAPMPYPDDLQPDSAEHHYPYSIASNTEPQDSCTHGNASDFKCDLMLVAGMMIVLATLIGGLHTNGCDHNIGLGNFLS